MSKSLIALGLAAGLFFAAADSAPAAPLLPLPHSAIGGLSDVQDAAWRRCWRDRWGRLRCERCWRDRWGRVRCRRI